nr:reverse transcriptase domain-containing protein [Tanacetum cinerariifolium]
MEKVRHDRRKDVHTSLDFAEGPKERIREDSYYSNIRARATEPGRVKVQDRLKYDNRHVLDRLGRRRQSAFDRLSETYSPSTTKSRPQKTDSRDSPRGRSSTRSLTASRDGRHKDRECLRSTRESFGDSFPHSYRDGSHHHHMKRKRDESPQFSASRSYSSDGKQQKSRRHQPTDEDDLKRPVWFDELPPESIYGYKDLRVAFMAYFMQQKKYVKDPVEIHNIKQRDGETIEDFMKRFKIETGRMKGAPECMRISGFMHGRLPPAKRRAMYPGSHRTNPKGTLQIKGPISKITQGREGSLTDLPPTRTPKEILATEARKKETAIKDKLTAIYMVQSWQRTVKQKVTQSFERVGEIAFPKLAASNGTEGPLVIEAEIATTSLTGFSGESIWPLGQLRLLVTIRDATHSTKAWMNFMVVKSMSPYNGIIGRLGLKAIQAVPSTVHRMLKFPVDGGIATIRSIILIPTEYASVTTSSVIPREERTCPANFTVALHLNFPDQEVVIGGSLSDKGRTEAPTQHPGRILTGAAKEKGQAPERAGAIKAEVQKLVDARIMREVYYHDWLSNPVMVKKHDGSWRMCVDFTDLNKACPQDCYPLPKIDWKVESLCGYPFKCFLDAYKGYHQIQLAEGDEEKTAFHTGQGVYCYTKMPFGLKNVGVTYQQLMDKAFESQVGRNIEVYVDDLVVKSYTEAEMMRDVEETFRTLRKVNMKLNPKKCSFGLVEGVFLGYVITPEGIKPCPDKTAAVLQLPSPRTIKEVMTRPDVAGWLQKWSIMLGEHNITYRPRTSVKGQILADFLIEIPGDVSQAAPAAVTQEESWTLFTDGSSCVDGSGAGLILTNP